MSTATTSSAPDAPSQWIALADNEVTLDYVERLLEPIHDDLWVSAACLDRLLEDVTVQKALLDLGVERTSSSLSRARNAVACLDSDEEEGSGRETEVGERARHASLLSYFATESADAQLCRIRAVLLERLDRLNTWVEVYKEAPVEDEGEEDAIDEEWEDDPWADSGAAAPTQPPPKLGKALIPLSVFLATDLVETACLLALQEHFSALCILVDRHGPTLWPYRFSILDCIPEYAPSSEYRELLPSYDPSLDAELKPSSKPRRGETDYVEFTACTRALDECGVPFTVPFPTAGSRFPSTPMPLSSSELSSWYFQRADHVLLSTGMADAALGLVQHAASQGVAGLDEVGEDLTLITRMVYDAPQGTESAAEDWSLERWRSMSPEDIVRAYLAYSTEASIARDIQKLVMPYLFVLESRAERTGKPDPSLITRMLHDYILNAPLDLVAAIFEASKPTLTRNQRIIKDDEDMARLALASLYGSDRLDQWPAMSRIFECLPAWDTPEDEADEADTTIASLGDFVTSSTTRPRATPSDLLLFFKPLPTTSLSRALDVLDVHLESGEILSRWSVPAPLRWFLQSNANIGEQRSRANRMARRANAADDQLDTQEDWEWLLEDMLKLAGSDEDDSWSAFCLLSRDDVIRIFFSGLLSTGSTCYLRLLGKYRRLMGGIDFDIAKKLLMSSGSHGSLDHQVIEDICLICSQEFYDNATSGNYHFGDMKLAYDWYVPFFLSNWIIQ